MILCLATTGSMGCVSTAAEPTVWPPQDFCVEVAGSRIDVDGRRSFQRFRMSADGLAIYREAHGEVPGVAVSLPVFSSVATYRVREESVRALGRLMQRAGTFDIDIGQSMNRDDQDSHVVVAWTAFGRRGQVSSFVDSGGVLDSLVHAVNAFLPPGRSFEYPELSGETQPPRLTRVPQPVDWLPGALLCHRMFTRLYPDDPEFQFDTFALAYAANDVATQRETLARIEEMGPGDYTADVIESMDWQRDFLDALRSLLPPEPPG